MGVRVRRGAGGRNGRVDAARPARHAARPPPRPPASCAYRAPPVPPTAGVVPAWLDNLAALLAAQARLERLALDGALWGAEQGTRSRRRRRVRGACAPQMRVPAHRHAVARLFPCCRRRCAPAGVASASLTLVPFEQGRLVLAVAAGAGPTLTELSMTGTRVSWRGGRGMGDAEGLWRTRIVSPLVTGQYLAAAHTAWRPPRPTLAARPLQTSHCRQGRRCCRCWRRARPSWRGWRCRDASWVRRA
jgi:hypothetical protein